MSTSRAPAIVAMSWWVLVSCGGSAGGVRGGQGEPQAIAESPQMQALFGRLSPPLVQGDQAPRLVLRDGPAVPDADVAPMPITIDRHDSTPPPTGPVASLKILSYAPTGNDDLTGAIRVTFDQPMVPVAQLRELHVASAPIEITPAVPGKLRWLGTSTLAFEPATGRLPLATDYVVRVPAGTRSVLGGALVRDLTFPIKTPVPLIVEHTPHEGAEGVVREPWLMLRFNQKIEPRVVAETLRVRGAAATHWLVVEADEFAAKRSEHPEISGDLDERAAVLTPSAALTAGTEYRVVLPAGFVGAEGPKPTTEAYAFTFRTIDPLRVNALRCGWDRCIPGVPVYLEFNNPIATTGAEIKSLLKVQPVPGDMEPRVEGNVIQLNGVFAPRTSYRVELLAGVRDIHGQTLERAFKGTIAVGDAQPELAIELGRIATLERSAPREIAARAINVREMRARVTKVERGNVLAVLSALERHGYGDLRSNDPFALTGPLVAKSRTIVSRAPANQPTTIVASIEEAVARGQAGYALVELQATQENLDARARSLVQVTDLNAIVVADEVGALVRVLSLSTAQPIAGALVEVVDSESGVAAVTATTDVNGVARLPVTGEIQRSVVRVTHGDDQALVVTLTGSRMDPETQRVVGTIITDRDPYRPGDIVHFKLLVRMLDLNAADSNRVPASGTAVDCVVHDAQYQEVSRVDGVLSEYGTFAADVVVPVGATLGSWHVACRVGTHDGGVGGTFQVQEYRAPEIEVSVAAAEGTFFHGDRTTFRVESRYLFGAPAAELPVDYTVTATPEQFDPPGHPEFQFGERDRFPMLWMRRPVHSGRSMRMRAPYPVPDAGSSIVSGHVLLGTDGTASVPVVLDRGEQVGPLRFQLEAAVTDLSRQQVAGRDSVISHPSSIYVGVRLARAFVADEEPIVASTITANVAGEMVAGRSVVTRLLREVGTPIWHPYRGLSYNVDEKEVGKCTETSAHEPKQCNFPAQQPGRYTIESTATDDRGRVAKTRVTLWVYGSGIRPWFSDTPSVEITADKESYAVGETAKLLVRAPIASGRGLLTLERRGIVESRAIDLDGSIQSIEVPITDAHVPNLTVRLSLVRGRLSEKDVATLLVGLGPEAKRAAAEDIGRPLHVSGSIELQVSRDSKRFAVTITPDQATHLPSEEMGVTVEVREPNGRAADADVTIMAVDEAVLSLLDYQTPDPLPVLLPPAYPATSLEVVADSLIRRVIAAPSVGGLGGGRGMVPLSAAMASAESGSMDESALMRSSGARNKAGGGPPAAARSLFATTAYYLASARTDDGKVKVRFKLPDNLTRFRLMAIAVGRGGHAGSGEGHVTVRKPLLLRPALPRVASFGDRFDAVVIAHNETGAAADVTIGIRAAGLSIPGSSIRTEHLAAGEAREVAFPVVVDRAAAAARVQFAAMTNTASDAVETEIPLIEPATSEAFATYGSLVDGAVRHPLQVPTDAIGRFGGLELSLSSTALTDLTDGVDYLLDYPYQCAEQLSSRLIGTASLSVALAGRDDERAAAMRAVAAATIEEMTALRQHDGGFAMWPSDTRDGPWRVAVTAWAALALHEATLAGINVSPRLLDGVRDFISQRLQQFSVGDGFGPSDQALGAYALSQLGADVPQNVIESLWQDRGSMPLFARAWLASVLRRAHPRRSQELLRQIRNAAVETASGAHFAESESEHFLWHSAHRTDAIVLRVLLQIAADDPLIEKTARGLSSARRNGRWRTTHENAWALSALSRYYRVAEHETPDLMARAWLGDALLSENKLHGRKTPTLASTLPMSTLQELGSGDLTIESDGDGRLYYRVGLRYAPTSLLQDPEEQGFAVTRAFEPIVDGADVRRDGDGTWHVKAGTTVRVRLTVVVPDTRYDVALDDPLAAGLEPLNLGFATTATQAFSEAAEDDSTPRPMWGFRCWMQWAFEHRELRDDRMTAFSSSVPAGVYEIVYLARATTPGRFIAAPTKIEEMYAPETFARASSEVVVVER